MEQLRLFPTNIFRFKNAYSNVNEIKNIILKERTDNPTWQSDNKLHLRPNFKYFVDMILQNNKMVLDTLQYGYKGFKINDMWANILEPGQSHPVHAHSNNFLSGVFYVYAEETSGIVFLDPRKQSSVIKPMKLKDTYDNSDRHLEMSNTNTMFIFPSWLEHFVPPNNSDKIRISISWNIQLFGEVGASIDFQSAEF